MNAAAAHAAFVMTISAARKYWLLRHAQQASDINIHKLHPLPEKIGLGSADFLHSGTGCVAVFVLILIFCRFQSKFFRIWKIQSRFQSRSTFCTVEHPFCAVKVTRDRETSEQRQATYIRLPVCNPVERFRRSSSLHMWDDGRAVRGWPSPAAACWIARRTSQNRSTTTCIWWIFIHQRSGSIRTKWSK